MSDTQQQIEAAQQRRQQFSERICEVRNDIIAKQKELDTLEKEDALNDDRIHDLCSRLFEEQKGVCTGK